MDSITLTALGRQLKRRGWFVASAESLTCGNVQSLIGSVSGSSEYFSGGITAYRIDDKARLLGVNREHAIETNAVSKRVAMEMAKGVCEFFNSDIGISTTGYAEPSPEMAVEQPFAFFALWHRRDPDADSLLISAECVQGATRSRAEMQHYVAEQALRRLADWLAQEHP